MHCRAAVAKLAVPCGCGCVCVRVWLCACVHSDSTILRGPNGRGGRMRVAKSKSGMRLLASPPVSGDDVMRGQRVIEAKRSSAGGAASVVAAKRQRVSATTTAVSHPNGIGRSRTAALPSASPITGTTPRSVPRATKVLARAKAQNAARVAKVAAASNSRKAKPVRRKAGAGKVSSGTRSINSFFAKAPKA